MPAFLLSPAGRWLVGVAGVLLALGLLYACGRQDGREAARVDSIERTLEAVETRRDVEDTVAAEPDPIERLLERWGRD